MAYAAGDKILDDEYNNFANSSSDPFGINHISGTGSAQYGLGETPIVAITAGDTIRATHWNNLFSAMDTLAGHTADTLTSTTARTAGDPIAIKSALIADMATLAASVAAGSPNTTATTTSSALQQTSSSSTWTGTFTTVFTVTFASANAMRFFFNAGGKVRVNAQRTGNGGTGGATNGKDTAWTNVYNALGNIDIGSQSSTRSGSGETLTTNGLANGFHDLTTSYQTIITVSDDTYPYTANNIKVEAKLNAAVGSSTNMQVRLTSTDGSSDFTFPSSNRQGANTNAYRNGQHRHDLFSINTTTGGGLANAYSPSSTATDGGTTT